ncbi:MAG: BTAD domain-containing putative transcriptional regulator [Pseudomonadota bacterium]
MPLNLTKITPPVTPHVLRRQLLNARLDAAPQKRVVLVLGQAAQGKSTLVADYLSQKDTPAAWLHLDSTDADPVNFFLLLVNALTLALKGITADVHLASPPVTLGPKAGRQRYRERIGRLLRDIAGPFNLVMDGMECLPPEAPSLQLIDWVLERLPADATAYLISRTQPALRLSRFRVRQEMILITNADLAFSAQEADAFFRRRLSGPLRPKHLKDIHRATEGWAGGLVLAAELMDHAGSKSDGPRLANILEHTFREETLAFFSEEIFAALPEETRAFLVAAALPETIEPRLLNGVVDTRLAESLFDDLLQRNLFIQTVVDPECGMRYRFHQLFRDFLLTRFERTTALDQQQRILSRLAENLDGEGRVEDAIGFYHRAGRIDRVADVIKKIGTDLVVSGRIADLHRYLAWIPGNHAPQDNWLAFYRILCRRLRKGPGDVDAFTAVNRAFTAAGDTKGMLLSTAYRIESAVFAGISSDKVLAWIADAESLLKSLRGRRYFAYAKTLLWMQVGFGAIAAGGNTRRGIAACEQACRMAERIGETTLQNNAAVIGAFGHITAGDFERATITLAAVGSAIDGTTYPEYRALRHILSLELMLIEGRFTEAEALVNTLQQEIDTHDLLFIYPLFIEQVGRLRICQGALASADVQVRHLGDIAALTSNPLLEALALRLEGAVSYHKGRYVAAARQLAVAGQRLTAHDPDCHHAIMVGVLQDVVGRHVTPDTDITAHLSAALAGFITPGNAAAAAEIHLALALAAASGATDASMRPHLEAGFAMISKNGQNAFLLLNRSDVIAACLLAAEISSTPELTATATAIMDRVVAPLPPDEASIIMAELRGVTPGGGSRADIATAPPPALLLHIRTFGGFSVCRDQTKAIASRDWGGGKPRNLLKAIIVHGVRDIPREVLMEDLWPESPPEAGAKRFKVTLHRLRKVLEPALNPAHGSRYVHLTDNRVSLDPAFCRVDVEQFLDAYKAFNRSRVSADTDSMMRAGRAATDIYHGEFLPEEPYAPWVEIKRAALRNHYLEMLQVMGDAYRQQGDTEGAIACFQAIVHTDPGVETAQRRLMALYRDLGRRHEAIRIYEIYRTYAESFLGIPPEEATTALYRRIVHRT